MHRCLLTAALTTVFLLGHVTLSIYPETAIAQQPESEVMFKRRISSRIDAVQSQVKMLERKLRGEDDEGGSGEYTAMTGIGQQLKTVDEQCRALERDLMRMSVGTSYDVYQRQRQLEYYVMGLENQVREIRKYLNEPAGEDAPPAQATPEPDAEEDGVSDEDWAADWATGDP